MPTPHLRIDSSPDLWLGTTPILDLGDDRLRLRARTLTQLRASPLEQAIAIYGYVKALRFFVPTHLTAATAREVLDDKGGSWYGKSTLLIALLRLCHIPARLRMVRLGPQHWRGLVITTKPVNHPMVEIWLGDRWQRTDTHVYDLRYMAAARAQLHRKGWQVGYGVHRNGDTIWNGREDAFATFVLDEPDGGPRADLGVYNDPMEFMRWLGDQAPVAGVRRAMHWGLVAARINHSVQALRKTRAGQAVLA